MFDIDRWREILSTIARNKLRTVITALGVFWGILMLVLLLGSGNGLKNGVQYTFRGFAVNGVYVWPQKTTLPYKGFKPGRFFTFRNADIEALKTQVPEIDIVAPRLQLGGWRDANPVARNNKSGNFQVMGDYPELRLIEGLQIESGRFLNRLDLEEKRKICVIGQQVKEELFLAGENPVGNYIQIKGVYFLVVGVFQSIKGQGNEIDQDRRTIFIPFTTFQAAFNFYDQLHWFALTAAPDISTIDAEEKVKLALGARHNIAPEDSRAIGAANSEEEADKYLGLFSIIRIFIWFVGIGTLIAGIIGVSNIMLIVVSERTKEIGIRKALGATPASIVFLIVQEAIFLTFLAGYSGLVAGVAILEIINSNMGEAQAGTTFLSPGIDFWTAMLATGIIVVAGALAGLMPAIKAINVNPIIALRSE